MVPNYMAITQERERLAFQVSALIRKKVATWPGGISHSQIATRSGLSKSFVTAFLNDKVKNPEMHSLAALAQGLGCTLEIKLAGRDAF